MPYIYAAIARYGNRDAGHVCYGRTKEDARTKARRQTSMTIVIRREHVSDTAIAALQRNGKL